MPVSNSIVYPSTNSGSIKCLRFKFWYRHVELETAPPSDYDHVHEALRNRRACAYRNQRVALTSADSPLSAPVVLKAVSAKW